jgi:hypothetical protein
MDLQLLHNFFSQGAWYSRGGQRKKIGNEFDTL